MKFRFIIFGFMLTISPVLFSQEEAVDQPKATEEAIQPEERPRLFKRSEMHPYSNGWGYYGSPYMGAYHHYGRHGYGSPFGFGYATGRYGFGLRSHLYYDTLYGALPPPGKSELTVSVGSNDYFGTSISTSNYLSKKHNILYNVSALWEQGETYWTNRDYDSFTIAPSFFWSNEHTSVYVGFEYTETNYGDMDMGPYQKKPNQENMDSMSPLTRRSQRSGTSELIKKGAVIGLEHNVNDFFSVGLHLDTSDYDRKRR